MEVFTQCSRQKSHFYTAVSPCQGRQCLPEEQTARAGPTEGAGGAVCSSNWQERDFLLNYSELLTRSQSRWDETMALILVLFRPRQNKWQTYFHCPYTNAAPLVCQGFQLYHPLIFSDQKTSWQISSHHSMGITGHQSLSAQKCFAIHILFLPASLGFEFVQGRWITWSKITLGGFHGYQPEESALQTWHLVPVAKPGKQ